MQSQSKFPHALGHSLGREIRCTEHMIKRRFCQMESEDCQQPLTAGQGVILGYIVHCGKEEVFQKDIEQLFNIRRSTATVTLQKMEQAGLIQRVAVESDARMKKIVVTQQGLREESRMEKRLVAMETEISKGISEQEKEVFLAVLHKINRNLSSKACEE